MTVDDELVEAFLEESDENLNQLDLDLVALEDNPQDPELLARIFRTIHTIKGTCGFLGFGNLERLSHAGEDLLARLRSGEVVLDEAITTSLLSLVDEVRGVLAVVAETGTEGDADHSAVIADLRRHLPPAPADDEAPTPTAAPAPAAAPSPTPTAPPPAAAAPAATPAPPSAAREESTVRIDVAVLDALQDLVGELTLARMRLGDFVPDDGPLALSYNRLTAITRELQDTVMRARLQPIATATGRLRRIVRDVAAAEGKTVHLVIEGEDVTVDKAINEILRDPLVHLVRNAVDHGIEPPAERAAAGKAAQATLLIKASLIGGGVHIDVTDDGRGINVERIVEKAIAAGRVTPAQAASMTDSERMALLFQPGVSTAEQVTTISGRGVGMDVVRAGLEQVGGSIEAASEPGRGTSFRINVPLTLAILPAIIVDCGPCRFTVPQTDVLAVARVSDDEWDERIHTIGEARFLRYHGTLLPLIDLAEFLAIESTSDRRSATEIVVIRKQDRSYGLIVDAVQDDVDAVVKPLPRAIRGLGQYAGTTVLSDGRPSLILETAAPAAAAELHSRSSEPEARTEPAVANNRPLLITVSIGDESVAIPLNRVRRLERVEVARVERSGRHDVLQYHGEVLAVADLGTLLGVHPAAGDRVDRDTTAVVVCRGDHPDIGLLVDAIGDIEQAPADHPEADDTLGTLGRYVLGGRVTQVLDVDWVAAQTASTGHRSPVFEAAGGSRD